MIGLYDLTFWEQVTYTAFFFVSISFLSLALDNSGGDL